MIRREKHIHAVVTKRFELERSSCIVFSKGVKDRVGHGLGRSAFKPLDLMKYWVSIFDEDTAE